ncbi:hypothetical protein NM688_g4721 [Phlebia brevispora]|uniref:Uncharacterized protein n=1 Tax=Phlebia brevispora TaxID=194682 RepID=A0ACC1T247_9APHY|nr:hypothetical protein NM688_g4721 [Phlebia brevispora]
MDSNNPLKILLQLQLATDSSAVQHLPSVLSSLNPQVLQPSSHTQKWTARVNSLIHSKDAGARWAGLCIAQQTSIFSKALMLECAQGWVTVVLPLLSKNEGEPIIKAAIRLLRTVFTTAMGIPEFQRQVSTPSVPKYTAALLSLIEKREEEDIKVLAMEALAHLVPLYPTLHRTLLPSMSSMSLRFLNGSAPKPMSPELSQAASKVYAVLHHTGGKVGAANQWRKSLDDTLAFAWGAFLGLRTTFKNTGYEHPTPQPSTSKGDPLLSVPLFADRLKAAVVVLGDLLQASTSRPVPVPIGSIVRLCQALLSCTRDEKAEGHIDPIVHSLELSALPAIWSCGSILTQDLSRCIQKHLTPHISRLCLSIARQLEQTSDTPLRLTFARALYAVLAECPLRDAVLASRLARAVLPALTNLLGTQSEVQRDGDKASANAGTSRKGKKRSRGYEGDEVFRTTKEVILPTKESGELVLCSIQVVRLLITQSSMTSSMQSLTGRILLAVYMAVPSIPPSLFAVEPALHHRVYEAVQRICAELGVGTASTLSKSLGLVIAASAHGPSSPDVMRTLDLQLHPRAPPVLRALPHAENLTLFRAEESQEECDIRRALCIGTMDELALQAPVQETISTTPGPTIVTSTEPTEKPPPQPCAEPAEQFLSVPPLSVVPLLQRSIDVSRPSARVVTEIQATRPAESGPTPRKTGVPVSVQPPPRPVEASSLSARQPTVASAEAPAAQPIPIVVDEDDEDEPMPSIDMGSDSESD